ncbi:hypothetical protein AB8P62_21305 [Yersinia enterocolitica]|uniref:hypothetical protein n=1 Tax=Yersinia enterocolitica TaxID=630 RepID=UPI0037D9192C
MIYKKELIFIIIVKIFFTFFAVYIYNQFSHLADSERYLNAVVSLNNFLDRTQFVDNIFAFLRYLISSKLLVNVLISIIFGLSFFCVFKDLLDFIDKRLLYILFLLPSFQIWTSVAGKEIIAVAGLLFFVKWVVNIQFGRKNKIFYLFIGLLFGVLLRPHYGIAYLYLAFSVILLRNIKVANISKGCYVTTIAIFSMILTLILAITIDFWGDKFLVVINIIKNYFLSSDVSYANRNYIPWSTVLDYFNNILWGIPVSLIGPTLRETIDRIIYLPFFIEGVIGFSLMIYIFYRLYKISNEDIVYKKYFYFSFIPAMLIILLIHYPFGLFNPGAAIRYKQNITPLIYFYPLLVLACIKKSRIKSSFE